jgi:heme A synthase
MAACNIWSKMRIAILIAGLIVCLPALGVALFLYDVPGAPMAAMASFGLIYLPFMVAAFYANTLKDFISETH